jgi:hypothetical protein
MILSRLSRAIREQNWFAVAIEFVIVVAGVVIGFQINGWNNDRIERTREAVILCRLQEEFARIEADVLQHVADAETTLTGAQAIRDNALRGMRIEDISRHSQTAVTLRAPPAGSATYAQLVSSGEMGLIRSRELREALTDYGEYAARHQRAGTDLSNMLMSSAGAVYRTIGLTDEQIDLMPPALRDELQAFVGSNEFMLAARSMEILAQNNFDWKQNTATRVHAVTAILATQTAHCGGDE